MVGICLNIDMKISNNSLLTSWGKNDGLRLSDASIVHCLASEATCFGVVYIFQILIVSVIKYLNEGAKELIL